ncbi:peptide ABC transporter substrate-binding protein [Bdellovibrio bacteriovorus]|uniref:Peptide ABC transporter substrate-binding protein n=1 Tax=Bdellovibrio bacteriovorus TaxID=959 RepID=A0A161PR73_BDEBC|nr:peptide-binding protein [Bdellovibrio bacteriovorus]KYG69263.1 peptide ABC transporter substrate-binding protein [Bdellovibrio bacteriovorus]
MNMKGLLALILSSALTAPAFAAAPNANAPKGGNFVFNLGGEPPTVHPITATDAYSRYVQNYVCDGMATRDSETYDWKPRLAEKWEISKDNKVFTFHLRKDAVFHDGTPVTAEDVKFSFDAIFEPKYEAAHLRPYYEGLTKAEVLDAHTIRFTARDLYFNNFESAATLTVIPKKIYSDIEKSKKMNRQLICAGPYVLSKFDRGQVITLKKFDKWYGNKDAAYAGMYNFDTITMRFYKDENVELERAKKGELDYLDLRVEAFMKKTEGAPWGKTIIKHKVENSAPKSYGFIGWNFRKELFQDRNVRVALAHLLNREEMNKKFRYGMSDLANGAIYLRSEYNPGNKALEFNPKKAQELLAKAGWTDKDKNGVLEKEVNGKRSEFKFTLIYPSKDTEKYYTMYREDLKKAGIDMELKYLEWNSFLKLVDEGNFDAVTMAWGGGSVDPDPKQIWHSASSVAGGSNFIAYKNPEVDKLIDEARVEPNKAKRVAALKKVYAKIAEDAPYAFLFNDKYAFYANSSRMGMPAETFKYEIGRDYWWLKAQ